ncbi:oligosaccharyl transferase, archaeosortase A system-associated [Chloroflexota bacterium]
MSKHQEARESRLSHKLLIGLLIGIVLTIFFAVALFIRVNLPYDRVFVGDWIKYTSADAYFHMRVVDLLVHNFPNSTTFDPYLIYPGGVTLDTVRLFDWLLAGIILLIGLGSPTAHTIDVVGVYFPAVLGALTVVPVYFIGRELFNRWAGLLSAGLMAILPGEFLGRSILGFTDHHIAETLFTTVTMLFLIMAIKRASQRQLTFSNLKCPSVIAKPVLYSLLAGVFMGAYILTFRGALLFVFIISVYFIIQFIIDHLRRKPTGYLCFVGAIFFFVALMVSLAIFLDRRSLASLIIAILIPLVLGGISRLMVWRGIKPAYYPLSLVGLGVAGVGIIHVIDPTLLGSMLAAFSVFAPTGPSLTTIEMQPILFPNGPFTTEIVWGNFTTSFFLFKGWPIPGFGLIALGYLIYRWKGLSAEKSLLVVWSLVILAATLGQRRFAYYFAVNMALLTGYLSWQALRLAGLKEPAVGATKVEKVPAASSEMPKQADYYKVLGVGRNATGKEVRKAFQKLLSKYRSSRVSEAEERIKEINMACEVLSNPKSRRVYDMSAKREMGRAVLKKEGRYSGLELLVIGLTSLIVFFTAFFWNIEPAIITASQARYAPSDAWISSLYWLKENTPEPFGNPDAYYQLHQLPPSGERYNYPESAYGVLAWWDYGYWITRIAHRIPNANPSQDPRPLTNLGNCFTSQDENSANEIVKEFGSSYVVIDYETATSKFWAIIRWAGKEQAEFFGTYYVLQENKLVPVQLFYPNYYHSLSTRLYIFDGQAVTPKDPVVISYQEEVDEDDKPYKRITSAQQFTSYEEAETYLLSQEEGNHKIVGVTPLSSPVPLEELEHYELIYSSNSTVALSDTVTVPAVKIFEYMD